MHSRYNQFPNKRRRNMSESKDTATAASTGLSGCASAFFSAEENFKNAQPDEWKVQNGRRDRRNKPHNPAQKDGRDNFACNRGRSTSYHRNDRSYRGGKRPSENKSSHNKWPPRENDKFHNKRKDNTSDLPKELEMEESKSESASTSHSNPNINKRHVYHPCLNYNKLQEISGKDSTDIIRILANSQSGLDELLSGDIKPDWMFLVVKILSKLIKSDWEENKDHILNRVATPEFFKKIREFVTAIVTDDHILESHKRREGTEQFFESLLNLYQDVMVKLPTFTAEHLSAPLKATKMAMENVSEYQNVTINQRLINTIKQLIFDFEERKSEKEEREKVVKEKKDIIYPKPFGDIQEIPLFPRPEDIVNTQGSVVPNKIKGPYSNVDHYLDVHFRLLREDFISPLRQGINDFRIGQSAKNSKGKRRVNNLRIYHRVKFLRTKVISDKVGYDICFDPERKLRIKWECTKRFLFGSLLLFTTDNFHTFFLATVIKRDLTQVEKDRVISIQLCETTREKSHDLLSKEFLMAESEVYFEPYYNVLKALKRFSNATFPMKKYIVNVETKTGRPAHTRNGSDTYTISAGDKGRKTIKLFDNRYWPSCSDLGFDESQLLAFKTALTNELAVIQGPPGTGKTYLGLRIAAALLDNSAMWNLDKLSPILVICFTNHALDQFLEGILVKGLTNNLIRIGGRSKSELLEPFNLAERRKSIVNYSPNYSQAALMKDIKRTMTEIFENIKIIQDNLENLEKNDGILSLKSMKIVMSNRHCSFFKNDEDLLQWLLMGLSHKIKSDKELLKSDNKVHGRKKYVIEEFEIDLADYENARRLKEVLFDKIDLEEEEDGDDANIAANNELRNFYSCTLHDIEKRIEQCTILMDNLLDEDVNKKDVQNKIQHQKRVECDLKDILIYLKENLAKHEVPPSIDEVDRLHSVEDPNTLELRERWALYKIWVSYMCRGNRLLMGQLEEQFRMGSRRFDEVRQFDDLRVVQQADVVGITTTTAARLQGMLRELKPKIVIVEEAAEVLEAHIVASLSVHCQHLILIGDHKQLRPSPSEYKLAKDFQLDVSLFERLVNNGVGYCTLSTQHRMRPEISRLLVPTIYPSLIDHPDTLKRERIRGMENNIFFMTHAEPEEDADDIMSKRNLFEAKLVMQLARHLLLQGYRPDEITVLTTYNGQMYMMKEEQRRLEISKDLLVTVVDNYQGEENKIILLSLVRSNSEKKIGFLKTENRVCVALSRARDGLFVFGNMDCLAAESVLWQNIKQSFIDQNAYGPALILRCETHTGEITRVVSHVDFSSVMEGGCSRPCGEALPCGHVCKSLCHVSKDRHTRYRCSEPCNRMLCNDNHLCSKKCYQDCGRCERPMDRTLECGHVMKLPCCVEYKKIQCKQKVPLYFPKCNHRLEVECFRRDYKQCPEPCVFRLECGHSCSRTCHVLDDPDHIDYLCPKPCAERPPECTTEGHKCPKACFEECEPCELIVTKRLDCGHSVTTECSVKGILCPFDCERELPCGHPCRKQCFEECGDCRVKVQKTVPLCGHQVRIRCSKPATKADCLGPCQVKLSCGHRCSRLCRDKCSPEFCHTPTDLQIALPCKHIGATLPCNVASKVSSISSSDKEQLLQYCKEPCLTVLKCEHRCSGTCGQCMQGRLHKVCEESCGNILICGHSCTVPCRMVCPPCNKPCQMRCMHNKCPKKCGEPCIPCKEPCEIRCTHTKCTKKCGEMCNRKPCTEPCYLPLDKCKHPCVGFCGEPCPPCKICEPHHYEIFFGTEDDEEDAKWVLLNDCKHVFESKGLEYWLGMDQEGSEIKLKKCPRCSTTVSTTVRYMDLVKKTFLDIQAVKKKVFGQIEKIREEREKLLRDINKIPSKEMECSANRSEERDELLLLYQQLLRELPYVKEQRRREIGIDHLCLLKFMVPYLTYMINLRSKIWSQLNEDGKRKIIMKINQLTRSLKMRDKKISESEIQDFQLEMERISRFGDLFILESSTEYKELRTQGPVEKTFKAAEDLVGNFCSFTAAYAKRVDVAIQALKDAIKSSAKLTEKDMKMIHEAMSKSFYGGSSAQGHWFKCPNGHIYVITECGGAMEEARCPEKGCGAMIGGSNHRYLPGQQLASEMDGASRPAWSSGYDMRNFDLDNLR